MKYRKLDSAGDMSFGHGAQDFHVNSPDAVAQAVKTRLHLELGEWFLDRADGTPWKTHVLGKYTGSVRDAVIRARIAGTQGVVKIAAYGSQVTRDTRVFAAQAEIDTVYGRAKLVEPI